MQIDRTVQPSRQINEQGIRASRPSLTTFVAGDSLIGNTKRPCLNKDYT